MIPKIFLIVISLSIVVSGCDGPNEKAGRAADRTASNASGKHYSGEGPNELRGEAQDRVDRSAAKAVEAEASSLEHQGAQIRANADFDADQLEERARELRAENAGSS